MVSAVSMCNQKRSVVGAPRRAGDRLGQRVGVGRAVAVQPGVPGAAVRRLGAAVVDHSTAVRRHGPRRVPCRSRSPGCRAAAAPGSRWTGRGGGRLVALRALADRVHAPSPCSSTPGRRSGRCQCTKSRRPGRCSRRGEQRLAAAGGAAVHRCTRVSSRRRCWPAASSSARPGRCRRRGQAGRRARHGRGDRRGRDRHGRRGGVRRRGAVRDGQRRGVRAGGAVGVARVLGRAGGRPSPKFQL